MGVRVGNISWEPTQIEKVWIGDSGEPGPTVGVLGGIHGDELTGVNLVQDRRSDLAIDCGRIVLILGNPEAVKQGSRDTGLNLNRQIRELTPKELAKDYNDLPYEVRRGQELRAFLDICDASLDLHDFTDPRGNPFIICERNSLTTARKIGAPVISFGWSKTEPGATDGYMFGLGREGLCYEVGQKDNPQRNMRRGLAVVGRFLNTQGLLEGRFKPLFTDPTLVQTTEAFIRTAEDYRLAKDYVTFQELKTGELIAVHGGERIYAKKGQVIIFPEPKAKIKTEAFTLGQTVAA
ncbi:MAG: succinylglutamate desuccinylase/aspartoacylase family protein [Patescibacteria group bacterium]